MKSIVCEKLCLEFLPIFKPFHFMRLFVMKRSFLFFPENCNHLLTVVAAETFRTVHLNAIYFMQIYSWVCHLNTTRSKYIKINFCLLGVRLKRISLICGCKNMNGNLFYKYPYVIPYSGLFSRDANFYLFWPFARRSQNKDHQY